MLIKGKKADILLSLNSSISAFMLRCVIRFSRCQCIKQDRKDTCHHHQTKNQTDNTDKHFPAFKHKNSTSIFSDTQTDFLW